MTRGNWVREKMKREKDFDYKKSYTSLSSKYATLNREYTDLIEELKYWARDFCANYVFGAFFDDIYDEFLRMVKISLNEKGYNTYTVTIIHETRSCKTIEYETVMSKTMINAIIAELQETDIHDAITKLQKHQRYLFGTKECYYNDKVIIEVGYNLDREVEE